MSKMLVPRSIVMGLVSQIDDAIDRLMAVPGCDSIDASGVNALVDLLGILDDCAAYQSPDGGGGRRPFAVVDGGLRRAA